MTYVLTWDGRLDNREEIAARLGMTAIDSTPDTVIVLKAYITFGESAFDDLIGEFALVLWCGRTRTLKFARSACGARTLYYALTGSMLTWSSSFGHLVRTSGVDLTVNDDYAVRYLVSQPSAKDSPLRNVHAVPPNNVVHFEDRRIRLMREMWDPTRVSPLKYRSDQECEEHCRAAIKDAVKVRLRAKRPVFCELSGGLDSSTIVMTADQILQERGESPSNLQTVSCVYEESRSCDEREFIRSIEESRGVATLLIHERDQRITLGLTDPIFSGLPNSLHCFPGRYETITRLMREREGRVLLTGNGGDQLFWSEPDGAAVVADRLFGFDLRGAHRECREWSRIASIPYYEFMTTRAIPLLRRHRSGKTPEVPPWIRAHHKKTIVQYNADFKHFPVWHSSPSRRLHVHFLEHMLRANGAGFFQEYRSLYVSHPYSYRPLVEFCLSMPISQFLRNGNTRSLIRRSMKDVLPETNRKRTSKGLLDETIMRALRQERFRISDLPSWQVSTRGYVDSVLLAGAFRNALLGILGLSGPLFRLMSLERWLRSLSRINVNRTGVHNTNSTSCLISAL
ncbi:MAG TPA: asparagine synthase-related protein [Candidatus Angelobacter sp.]|nr:asparagine synthase-related protein [Candidatus Angelobacter sp.]